MRGPFVSTLFASFISLYRLGQFRFSYGNENARYVLPAVTKMYCLPSTS